MSVSYNKSKYNFNLSEENRYEKLLKIDKKILFYKNFLICKNYQNKYEIFIFLFKLIKNNLYLYKLNNGEQELINIFQVNCDLNLIVNNIKIDPEWNTLSIPDGDSVIIYSIDDLLNNKFEIKNLKLNLSYENLIDNNYSTYIFNDNIIRIFKFDNKIKKLEFFNNNETRTINFIKDDFEKLYFSNNGKFILFQQNNNLKILNLLNEKSFSFKNLKGDNIESKWLISNDGNIIICKKKLEIKIMILLDNNIISNKVKILENDIVMLKENIFNNKILNSIIIFNKINSEIRIYNIYDLKILKFNKINYNLGNFNKLSTNGDFFIFKDSKNINIINIKQIINLNFLKYETEMILQSINLDNKIMNEINLENNSFSKNIKLTNNTKKIFLKILKTNNIKIDSYEYLNLPIIEDYNDYDSIDLYFKFIDNVDNIKLLLDRILNDELFQTKIKILIKVFIEISKNIYYNCISNNSIINSKKYIELVLLSLFIYLEDKLENKDSIKKDINNFLVFNNL